MKHHIHGSNLFWVAAFVIGVILFAAIWKGLFGAASSLTVLAGMLGVATMVIVFRVRNELQRHKPKEK